MKCVIYDIEIVKAIPDRKQIPDPHVLYCDGWHDHENMGISVVGAYDYNEDRYRVFFEDNKEEFNSLIKNSDLLITFNGLSFDNKVIESNWFPVPDDTDHYDILVETWAAHGLSSTFNYKTHGGFSLDTLSEVNFGQKKTGNGALAPVHWQKNRRGTVVDYCLQDIRLTKLLFDRIVKFGNLISPKTSKLVNLRNPYDNYRI